MICIYHSKDLDGWMSAAIIKLKYPNVKLIGWDYGQPAPELNPETEDTVVMVDVSFPKTTMDPINELFNLTWIDHHISAIKDMEGLQICGMRDPKFAACELTWKYFFPEKEMPEIVRLLGRYDYFGHKGTDEELRVLQFQYGARQCISSPDGALFFLKATMDGSSLFIYDMENSGTAIYKYLCTEAKSLYARRFEQRFPEPVEVTEKGYPPFQSFATRHFACVNAERFNPINFGIDYHKDGYDGFACFWYERGKWKYSLYNDNGEVDCSAIAKTFGGGGHKGASGFVSETPIIDCSNTLKS